MRALVHGYNYEHRPARSGSGRRRDLMPTSIRTFRIEARSFTKLQGSAIRPNGKGGTRNWKRVDGMHLNADRIDNYAVALQRRNLERKAAWNLIVEATTSLKIFSDE
jgi:hypothetical protein